MSKTILAAFVLSLALPLAAQVNLDKIPDPATLKTLNGSSGSYSFTEDDLLWLARMIHGETGGSPTKEDAEAMIWAIAQRKYFAKGFQSWDLATMVQKYSQPVNTKWLRDGPVCGKLSDAEVEKLAKGEPCAKHRFAKREKYAKIEWKDISQVARQAVVDFASGSSVNPIPGGVGWYAKGLWEKREKNGANQSEWEKPVHGWEIEQNVFYKSAAKASNTESWSGTEVTVK